MLFSFATNSMAQNISLDSTLNSAKNLRNAGNFGQAVTIMENFNKQSPDNIWLMQLYAETLFWMKKYKKADSIYRRAIRIYPGNFEIKYEYSIFLFDRGNYKETRKQLLLYTEKITDNTGAESILGITDYYLGNFKEAERHLKRSLTLNPDNQKAREVYTEVSHIVKPWFKGSVFYTDDSQPLNQWNPAIMGGWYYSHYLNLSFALNHQNFSADSINSNMTRFRIQNDFIIPGYGIKAAIFAGGFHTSIIKAFDLIWGINIDKRVFGNLHVRAAGERSPYTYTTASIESPFLRNKYSLSFSWETPQKWNASIGYIGEYFPDINNVKTAYAWALSPQLKFSFFRVNIGYAFNYANSKSSRYVSELPLDEILENYQPDQTIKGIYQPYFTPNTQYSNSVLANIYFVPSKKIIVKLKSSVGFYSRTMNPYLYLDNENGQVVIKEDFYQVSFTPLDVGISFHYDITDKTTLFISYTYLQTFYFSSNNINAGLKIYF